MIDVMNKIKKGSHGSEFETGNLRDILVKMTEVLHVKDANNEHELIRTTD